MKTGPLLCFAVDKHARYPNELGASYNPAKNLTVHGSTPCRVRPYQRTAEHSRFKAVLSGDGPPELREQLVGLPQNSQRGPPASEDQFEATNRGQSFRLIPDCKCSACARRWMRASIGSVVGSPIVKTALSAPSKPCRRSFKRQPTTAVMVARRVW
jgi:hypothetical protein